MEPPKLGGKLSSKLIPSFDCNTTSFSFFYRLGRKAIVFPDNAQQTKLLLCNNHQTTSIIQKHISTKLSNMHCLSNLVQYQVTVLFTFSAGYRIISSNNYQKTSTQPNNRDGPVVLKQQQAYPVPMNVKQPGSQISNRASGTLWETQVKGKMHRWPKYYRTEWWRY